VAKSEPKAPPAPVQPPAVPKKVEPPKPASQPKEAVVAKTVPPVSGSGVGYPYSVYLGSVQGMDYVKRGISTYESQGLLAYWSKVDLGTKGTWYRIFTGYFRSAQEAESFIQQKRIKDGEVKETRYTNLIGTFGSKQAGEERALALARMGLSAYWIPAPDGQVRVYSGAFITKDGAEKNQSELNSKGIKSEIVER
jgi:cell division septation protein DedD